MGTSDKPGAEALGGGLPQQRRIDDRCHKGLQDGHRQEDRRPSPGDLGVHHEASSGPVSGLRGRELLERFIKGEVCDLAPEAPLMSRVATAVQDRAIEPDSAPRYCAGLLLILKPWNDDPFSGGPMGRLEPRRRRRSRPGEPPSPSGGWPRSPSRDGFRRVIARWSLEGFQRRRGGR